MEKQVIGSIPEFSTDETSGEEEELKPEMTVAPESGAEAAEKSAEEEKETPPALPTEEQPASVLEREQGDDTGDLREQLHVEIEGLKDARRELIHELQELRGQKREVKKEEIAQVEEKIDQLEDVNSDDVALIDRILKAKGYISQQGVQQMLSEARKQDEFLKFAKEFPEYSEVNDPDRRKFGPLLRELDLYRDPKDAAEWGMLLRRAHREVMGTRISSDRDTAVKKQQANLAGVGSGGIQRSSSVKSFNPKRRAQLVLGGWSEEDIQRMEERLNE